MISGDEGWKLTMTDDEWRLNILINGGYVWWLINIDDNDDYDYAYNDDNDEND